MSLVSNGLETLKTMVKIGDPSLPRDLRDVLGFLTTDERIAADLKQSDDDLIIDIVKRLGTVEQQLRAISELGRTRAKLTELALTTAAQADSQAAATADQLARVQWALQEQVASFIQENLSGNYGDKYEDPPGREHARRAVEETVEAAGHATTPAEERLLIDVLVGSLTPDGMTAAIGARLRKLVTSRQLGPAEISLLRRCHQQGDWEMLELDVDKGRDLNEAFTLASVFPALVTLQVNHDTGPYVTRVDQLEHKAISLVLRITDRGIDMVHLLDEAKRLTDRKDVPSARE